MVRKPDGTLVVTQTFSGTLRAIAPDGQVTTLGLSGVLPLVRPAALALAADGTLYVGETPDGQTSPAGRILAVSPAGVVTVVPTTGFTQARVFAGLAVGPDGTLVALESNAGELMRRSPGGAWQPIARDLRTDPFSRVWLGPDGTTYVGETRGHRVSRVAADGTVVVVAGTGEAGSSGDGGPATAARLDRPAGLWLDGQGTLFIADGLGLVRAVHADGKITTVAGTVSPIVGDALTVSVNTPGGLALDASGRLLIAEAGSNTIKRLDGSTLVTIAGVQGAAGFAGDGGPATAANLAGPGGLAFRDGVLWFVDGLNRAIRRIDAAGQVTTVASAGPDANLATVGPGPYPATAVPMINPLGVAVSPTGQVYWSDGKGHRVFRLAASGEVELVAGANGRAGETEDGPPARACHLNVPMGLAFDATGDLYIAVAGNSRILKLAAGDPGRPFSTVAGLTTAQLAGRTADLAPGTTLDLGGQMATEAILFGPTSVAFDAKGNLYICELGTGQLASVAGDIGLADIIARFLPRVGPRIRQVSPAGEIRTVAGDGTAVLNDPALDDFMVNPINMVVDGQGGLVIADPGLNLVKVIPARALEQ